MENMKLKPVLICIFVCLTSFGCNATLEKKPVESSQAIDDVISELDLNACQQGDQVACEIDSGLRGADGIIAYDLLFDPRTEFEIKYGKLLSNVRSVKVREYHSFEDKNHTYLFDRAGRIETELYHWLRNDGTTKDVTSNYHYKDSESNLPKKGRWILQDSEEIEITRDKVGNVLTVGNKKVTATVSGNRYKVSSPGSDTRYYRGGYLVEEMGTVVRSQLRYEFHDNGNVKSSTTEFRDDIQPLIIRKRIVLLDEGGNIVRNTWSIVDRETGVITPDGDFVVRYEFDDRGNWTMREWGCGAEDNGCLRVDREIYYY